MLAGGLSPENVQDAIRAVRPWAVDASSSLEIAPGIKDHERIRAFVQAAQPPVRGSGPVEGVWGNREVPPAGTR
jgi:phosphoribosylanthranilate isomerase